MSRPVPSLPGKVVFITGAARGIGAESARQLAAAGARVALVGLEPEELERVATDCGPEALWIEADVTDSEALERAVAETVEHFGGIDVVVANAGVGSAGTVRHIDPAAFERTIEINLIGVWRTVRACLPHVIDRRGYVLVVSSLSAVAYAPGMAAYSATKAGVEAFANALRLEVRHLGVDVGVAYFSWIATDMVAGADAHPAIGFARADLRGPLATTHPVSSAGAAVLDGISRRRRWVTVPSWLRGVLVLRGLWPLFDRLARPRRDRDRRALRPRRRRARRRRIQLRGRRRAGCSRTRPAPLTTDPLPTACLTRNASPPDVRSSSSAPAPRCCARSATSRSTSPSRAPRARPTPSPRASSARPRARARSAQENPRPVPAPGGAYREYWIQARSAGWNIVPTGRDDWHGGKIGGKTSFRAYLYQQMTPGFAAAKRRPEHARADALRGGRRRARRALPQRRREAAPAGHDAPARGPLQPRVRRRLPGQVHARRRLRRTRRGVHLLLGVRPGLGRRLAVPRPRAQPHGEHHARAVRRARDQREGREGPRRQLHADAAPAAAADHRPRSAPSSASTDARTPATRRR